MCPRGTRDRVRPGVLRPRPEQLDQGQLPLRPSPAVSRSRPPLARQTGRSPGAKRGAAAAGMLPRTTEGALGCWAMKPGRHLVVSLVALAMAGVAAGCGGGGDNTGEVMRATLTGDGCRYQGDTTPAPGLFTIEVRNESSERADFHLVELPAGTTLEEVESWIEETRRRYEQTGMVSMPPHHVGFLGAGRTPRDQRASRKCIHGKFRRPLCARARLVLRCQ